MKFAKNKTKATVISLFLVLTIAMPLVALSIVNAHTPAWQIPTYAYIHAVPNPVGIGQPVNVFLFLTNYYYGAQFENDLRFHNFKLTITSPSGEVETQTFATIIDTTSNQMTKFTPDEVGTYTLEFTYPGETYTSTEYITGSPFLPPQPNQYTNDTFLPSSATTTLTVQEEQIPAAITSYPLPAEYWTRPIYGENTDWWSISSNWLGIGAPNYGGWSNLGYAAMGAGNGQAVFPGDAIGPQTAHVMWTKPQQSGGVVGGNNFAVQGDTYFDGSAYLIRFDNPIILDGMLYYNGPIGFSGSNSGPTTCVDLRTGKLIWSRSDVPNLAFGMIFDVQTQNQHGVCQPIIVSVTSDMMTGEETWNGFDGYTGDALFTATNIPDFSSGRVMGPMGEYVNYVLANAGDDMNPDWRLGSWNSSKLFFTTTGNGAYSPTIAGTINGGISNPSDINCRYDWNVSIPWRNTMTSAPTIVSANYNDGILCYSGTLPSNGENMLFPTPSTTPYTYFFINLNPSKGAIGSVLWWKTLQPPANNYTVVQGGVDWNTRIFTQTYKENTNWVGYSLESGDFLWEGPQQAPFDYYGSPSAGTLSGQIAYGRLYSCAMGGILYCYDDKTGELLWTYGNGGEGNSTNSGFNWPYGNIPTFINAIGNGVVYLVTSEHTWVSPVYKGGLARAVNATDGSEIWTISSATIEFGSTSYAIADGFATWWNSYDNSIYVVGRGPSATTVAAPAVATPFGAPVVISGTVTDIATGTTQDEQAARFPNGVPVISDASMKDWMGYVYQQKPLPADAVGVEVTISVLDSNNNCYDIGTATTDTAGFFHYTWTPDIPGDFKVIATFAGTNGYWPSYSEAAFTVMQEPEATPAPTPPPASLADIYILPGIIGIIIAIAVVGLVIIMMLRKR